jgi:hypothetical protein
MSIFFSFQKERSKDRRITQRLLPSNKGIKESVLKITIGRTFLVPHSARVILIKT